MNQASSTPGRIAAFSMIEILIVVAILATLASLAFPAFSLVKEKASMATHVSNVKQFTTSTLRWAADNNQTLPSPLYPGGHGDNFTLPDEWDFTGAGTGLWLDGVVFYATYFEEENNRRESRGDDAIEGADGDSEGSHLKGTFFESIQSVKRNPTEKDWHKHSYAMNEELQYDYIYNSSSDPYRTEKNLARLVHRPNAVLFIENSEDNIIGFDDREAILETGKQRWRSEKVIASFLDGHVATLASDEIPEQDPYNDRESSKFWRGVDVDTFTGR